MGRGVGQAPAVAVLAVVAAGLGLAATGRWRAGGLAIALALLLAAALRAGLSPHRAGWLVVRTRAFDSLLLAGLGVGIAVLVATVPLPA